MKYQLNDLTPREMQCLGGIGCPAIYELTPKDMQCIVGACPAIYEITPREMDCVMGACPSIHVSEEDYLIVGKKANPTEFGLEGRVGENEVLISVPKRLIDEKGK